MRSFAGNGAVRDAVVEAIGAKLPEHLAVPFLERQSAADVRVCAGRSAGGSAGMLAVFEDEDKEEPKAGTEVVKFRACILPPDIESSGCQLPDAVVEVVDRCIMRREGNGSQRYAVLEHR